MDHPIIDFSAFTTATSRPYRRFLFLQGPHGSFFSSLAKTIIAEGHSVHRIHLNGGDRGDWMAGQGISYTGMPSDWQQYLAEYLFRNSITDVVFYGCNRFYHRVAAVLAGKLDIRVHGFGEGQLQPGYITLDPRLPDEQHADIKAAMETKAKVVKPYGDLHEGITSTTFSTIPMMAAAIRYTFNEWRYRKLFSHYRSHRPLNLQAQASAWAHQAITYPWRKFISASRIRRIQNNASPVFILCLQRDSDSLVQKYSDFENMNDVIGHVLESFAKHAPANAALIVKGHPFDNGAQQPEKTCRAAALHHDIAKRVSFIHFGDLSPMLDRVQGVITVNSTAGMRALQHGKAVKTLGQAIYNISGLTDNRSLNEFWTAPEKPDAKIHRDFKNILLQTSQLPGDFYNATTYRAVIKAVVPLLTAEDAQTDASVAANDIRTIA